MGPDYAVLAANRAFSHMTGYVREEVLGRNALELPCSRDARRHYRCHPTRPWRSRGAWEGELIEARKSGELYPQWLQLNRRDGCAWPGRPPSSGFFADLSARRESEERLRYLAHYDELTGLANRALFRLRLHEAGQRLRGSGGAAWRCCTSTWTASSCSTTAWATNWPTGCSRPWPSASATQCPRPIPVARLSGDEFVVLDGYSHLSSLVPVAMRLLDKLRVPLACRRARAGDQRFSGGQSRCPMPAWMSAPW